MRHLIGGLLLCVGIALFTWLGFKYFPGHTYLQSDTQIYLPIMERLASPGYLARDLVATRPHVSFTIYDEVTLALRKAAKLGFEQALQYQQLAYRALGMLGVYLLAVAIGSPPVYALLISALVNLGSSLLGPAVLLVEYEPVPRGFAFGLILLSLGLLAYRQTLLAALAAGLALLYHPPTTAPFWGLVLLAFLLHKEARKHWKPLVLVLVVSGLLLANLAQLQPNVVESQNFFGKLSGRMIEFQHFRTRYSYVSFWAPHDIWHYIGSCICALWATGRIWPGIRPEMRWFFIGLPIGGVLTIPLSYLLLEHWHLAIIPQFQPARAVLYTVAFASISCGLAAVKAAAQRRVVEAGLWLLVVLALPIDVCWFDLFRLTNQLAWQRFAIWVGLATGAAMAITYVRRVWLQPVALAIPAIAIYTIPVGAHVFTYAVIDKKPVTEVAEWAKRNTWGSAMFLFPDAGHDPYPGIFRALAARALWTDWKSGGQVSYFESFAEEWYPRFEQTMDGKFTAARLEDMLSLPIDYYVVKREHSVLGMKPVFQNRTYRVYDAQELRNASTSLRIGIED